MALAAYRHVLRATRIAFQGDARLLDSARQEARKGFENSHVWSADSKEAIAGIAHAEEVARMLRHNIVQGQHAGEQSYKLRIHDDIERGDNDTIKTGTLGKACQPQTGSSR